MELLYIFNIYLVSKILYLKLSFLDEDPNCYFSFKFV